MRSATAAQRPSSSARRAPRSRRPPTAAERRALRAARGADAMIRLFVAIDLPGEVRDRLWRACCDVPGARWTEVEQMHLTLRFLGEVDELVFRDVEA
ncbi:MAG: 2'-5' RNA ligase family protein, partial [Alphaproteobacteria bacterium]